MLALTHAECGWRGPVYTDLRAGIQVAPQYLSKLKGSVRRSRRVGIGGGCGISRGGGKRVWSDMTRERAWRELRRRMAAEQVEDAEMGADGWAIFSGTWLTRAIPEAVGRGEYLSLRHVWSAGRQGGHASGLGDTERGLCGDGPSGHG